MADKQPKKVKKKTNRAARKRFKLTATGKVVRGHAKKRHNTGGKTTKHKRHLRHDAVVDTADAKRIVKLITS